ncbi:hypothetical protein [Methanoplanus limicola]|uniref:hypothetical protein n=1 Tax=Methanoplanus limicola TaxID=2315 RepID=UPI0012F6A44C|nr:hypothetical protein [Methanoplanus limicola]
MFLFLSLISAPALAGGMQVTRDIQPETPQGGETVTMTVSLPPSYYGGIIEKIPEGFDYAGSEHPADAVKTDGQNVIFAVTGEEEIVYSIKMPEDGCGYLYGEWEDFSSGLKGSTEETLLTTPGADTSDLKSNQKSPGFASFQVLAALSALACIYVIRRFK